MEPQAKPLTVVLETADIYNKNKYCFPLAELQKLIGHKEVMGECNPKSYKEEGYSHKWLQVDLEHVSHTAANFRMVGNNLVCDVTPFGLYATVLQQQLAREDTKPCFAMRYVCTFQASREGHIVRDLRLITVDAVYQKS